MRDTISSNEIQSLESLSALVRSKLAADAASTLERVDSYALDGLKDEGLRETILNSVSKRSALVFGWSEAGESTSVSINLLGSMPDKLFHVEQSVNPVWSEDNTHCATLGSLWSGLVNLMGQKDAFS